jgi:hypothetical protein
LKNPTFSPQIVADKRRSGKQSAEKQKIQRLILLSRLDEKWAEKTNKKSLYALLPMSYMCESS